MRSRLFLNIFLFLIVIGLALFLARTTNDVNEQDIVLTSLDPDSVNNIKIIRRDLEEISFSKQDNQWVMQTPYEIAANRLRINTMLKLLQAHSYTQLDSNDVELNQSLLAELSKLLSCKEDEIVYRVEELFNNWKKGKKALKKKQKLLRLRDAIIQ